jgi:peptidoglycan-N-acetylglucosamine deacetylase
MNWQEVNRVLAKFYLYLLVTTLLCISCVRKNETVREAGIVLSFDDHFIADWYALRPIFKQYGAKVTFYITCRDSLRHNEVAMLKQLQADGHEVAFHGTLHARATNLMDSFGPDKYVEMELSPGMNFMAAAGFRPTSYAHPGGNHDSRVDSVLFANGFTILRDVAISRRVFKNVPLYAIAPRIMNDIYYRFDKSREVNALLIDFDSGVSFQDIEDAIKTAKDTHTALMLFGHQPLYAAPKNGAYGFDVALLEKTLKAAKAENLKFYTMSELPAL